MILIYIKLNCLNIIYSAITDNHQEGTSEFFKKDLTKVGDFFFFWAELTNLPHWMSVFEIG